jgi:DNA repair exonuclease SbcCD ATPase subunit
MEQETLRKEFFKALRLHPDHISTEMLETIDRPKANKQETSSPSSVEMQKWNYLLQTKIQEISSQLQAEIQELRNQLREEIQETANQLRKEIQEMNSQLRTEMREMVGKLEEKMDERFNRLETKVDSLRIELSETQETVDFLSSKTLQHERKIRELYRQQ